MGYIANHTRAFKTFAASRVHMIQENNNVEQWKYVPSKENPADDTSRDMNFKNSLKFIPGSKIPVEATAIIGGKFGSSITAIRRSRIEDASENKQECC